MSDMTGCRMFALRAGTTNSDLLMHLLRDMAMNSRAHELRLFQHAKEFTKSVFTNCLMYLCRYIHGET